MTTTLNLPGQNVTRPDAERHRDWRDLESFGVHVEVLQEQEVIGVVRGEPLSRVRLMNVKEDADDSDVVELRFDGGVTQYLSVRDLRDDSLVVDGQIEVPAVFARGSRDASRGVADWVLRGLRVLRIRPDVTIADLAEDEVVNHFERRLTPPEGLYRVSAAGELSAVAGTLDIARPWLVFVHGTASSTKGSFGELFGTPEWSLLRKFYDERVLAFQHRTLSVSPIDNALELAERLPAGSRLHLVTHSRGGLIGELLGVTAFDDDQALRAFRNRPDDKQKLIRLRDLVKSKQFTIEKFVRVAAPARGTILASKRLDIYLSVILNVVGALPALAQDPLYSLLKATAMELIRRRTDPKRLPGLEAMMPESPLIHFLNQGKGLSSTADLAVIAGDLQGEGFWGRLKAFVTDSFYLEEHDLVVNTAAMFGGVGRGKKAAGVFDRGGEVNHFSYFGNERTRGRLHAWLTSAPNAGFSEFDPAQPGINIPVARAGADPKRPILIVVPDVLGSVLALTDLADRPAVWLDVEGLARHGFDVISSEFEGPRASASDIIGAVYQPLVDSFANTHQVIPFPWDWRKSMAQAATALEQKIAKLREENQDRRIDLIGHGAGGLVIRKLSDAAWALVKGRALLLATPESGMFAAVEWCSPRSRLVRLLARADGPDREASEIAERFRTFDAVLELLPEEFLDPNRRAAAWRRVNTPIPARLDDALKFRKEMPDARGNMLAVAGRAPQTPVDFDDARKQVLVTASGDGHVLTDSLHPKIRRWRVEAAHGDLPAHAGAFSAYLQLLTNGETKLLSQPQQVSAPLEPKPFTLEPLLFPSVDELIAEAFGSHGDRAAQQDFPLAVSVTHGDLRVARYPVAVGHHLGDSIVSAEAVLDCQLNRRLSRRFHMGIYPAAVGSSEIIRDPEKSPPGAIIIGLGEVGSVTAEIVRRAVTAAALRYALAVDEARTPEQTSWQSAAFASVLIGTRGGSKLNTVESIAAIVRGAIEANRLLRAQKLWDRVRIDAVELIELYEQRAISALYAARKAVEDVSSQLEKGERVDLVQILRPTASGQSRMPPEDWQTGWWQRLSITLEPARSDKPEDAKDRPFRYLVLTDKARVEARLQCNERGSTAHLIESGIKTPRFDPEISGALFELLVPNEIKAAADAAPRVVLMLDSQTAQYPWEMLADVSRPDHKPQSVRSGMIRQFITSEIRYAPHYSEVRNALIVGDTDIAGPVTVGKEKVTMPVLPGAQAEGQAVSMIVSGAGYQVTTLISRDAATIQKQLFARQYRIVHLAGHGIYNPNKPAESGMLLGSDIYLTACQLRQMRIVPDIVFINCCFLGQIDLPPLAGQPHRLAASVAQELINMGVKAIVAAGWAVDDSAAVTFASTFYDQMLNGRQQFGNAVRKAREAVFTRHPSTNTWAAYQCYGNPGFSLADPPEEGVARDASKFCARREYIDELHSLAAQANALGSGEDAKTQKEKLIAALNALQIPQDWQDGELLMRLGFAWRDLGDFRKAVDCLDRALQHGGGKLSLEGLEQLGNMHSRVAVEEHFAGNCAERDQHFANAHRYLDLLVQLAPTAERYALLGSAQKKRAAVVRGDERLKLLREAAQSYGKAAAEVVKPYPLLNQVAVEWVVDPRLRAELQSQFDAGSAVIRELRQSSDFWDRLYTPDYALIQQLLSGALDVDALVDEYSAVAQQSGSDGQKRSVIEQAEFIAEMLSDSPEREALRAALRDLAQRLRDEWGIAGGKFE